MYTHDKGKVVKSIDPSRWNANQIELHAYYFWDSIFPHLWLYTTLITSSKGACYIKHFICNSYLTPKPYNSCLSTQDDMWDLLKEEFSHSLSSNPGYAASSIPTYVGLFSACCGLSFHLCVGSLGSQHPYLGLKKKKKSFWVVAPFLASSMYRCSLLLAFVLSLFGWQFFGLPSLYPGMYNLILFGGLALLIPSNTYLPLKKKKKRNVKIKKK